MLCVLGVVLGRHANQDSVLVGTPTANRAPQAAGVIHSDFEKGGVLVEGCVV